MNIQNRLSWSSVNYIVGQRSNCISGVDRMMAVTVFRPEHVELNLSMLLSRFRKNVEHLSGVVKMTPSSMSRAAEDNNGMLEDRGVRWGGGAGEGAARPALSPPSTGGGTILEHGPSDRDSWCWRACFARVDADAALGMGAPSSRRQMWPRHALLRRDAHARLDAADAGATPGHGRARPRHTRPRHDAPMRGDAALVPPRAAPGAVAPVLCGQTQLWRDTQMLAHMHARP